MSNKKVWFQRSDYNNVKKKSHYQYCTGTQSCRMRKVCVSSRTMRTHASFTWFLFVLACSLCLEHKAQCCISSRQRASGCSRLRNSACVSPCQSCVGQRANTEPEQRPGDAASAKSISWRRRWSHKPAFLQGGTMNTAWGGGGSAELLLRLLHTAQCECKRFYLSWETRTICYCILIFK